MRQRKAGIGPLFSSTAIGSEYTPEEVEFLRAIDRYKRANRRPFPTWLEVLNVLRELGWGKGSPSRPDLLE